MQLEAESVVGKKFFNQLDRTLTLRGGSPWTFYSTILEEIPEPEFAGQDGEWCMMNRARRDWKQSPGQALLYGTVLGGDLRDWKPSALQARLLGTDEATFKDSEELIGIKLSLLKKIGKNTELKCLRMFLSLLEATSDMVATAIEGSLKEGSYARALYATV
jgi:hypothetical protein